MVETGATKRRRIFWAVLLVVVVPIGYFAIKVMLFVSGKPTISISRKGVIAPCVRGDSYVIFDRTAEASETTLEPAGEASSRQLGRIYDHGHHRLRGNG